MKSSAIHTIGPYPNYRSVISFVDTDSALKKMVPCILSLGMERVSVKISLREFLKYVVSIQMDVHMLPRLLCQYTSAATPGSHLLIFYLGVCPCMFHLITDLLAPCTYVGGHGPHSGICTM